MAARSERCTGTRGGGQGMSAPVGILGAGAWGTALAQAPVGKEAGGFGDIRHAISNGVNSIQSHDVSLSIFAIVSPEAVEPKQIVHH